MRYLPQLDGLRAACIVFTVINHTEQHPWYLNGSVGVDVFFALSGFLITSLLIGDSSVTARPCLKCFYIRRFFRIVPLYYFVFALYVAAAGVLQITGRETDTDSQMTYAWPSVLAFTSEYRPVEAGTFFGHAWTLGIEEKYYLFWPLAFLVLQRMRYRLQVAVLALLFCAEVLFLPDLEMRGYAGLTIGSLVAIALSRPSGLKEALLATRAWVYVLALSAAYLAVLLSDGGRTSILISLSSALLIGRIANIESATSRLLALKPLAILGRLTYGVYLVHVLVANAVAFALEQAGINVSWAFSFLLTYSVSIAVAALLKIAIEDPLISLGRRLAARAARRVPHVQALGSEALLRSPPQGDSRR